jgi:hypothetical protein
MFHYEAVNRYLYFGRYCSVYVSDKTYQAVSLEPFKLIACIVVKHSTDACASVGIATSCFSDIYQAEDYILLRYNA